MHGVPIFVQLLTKKKLVILWECWFPLKNVFQTFKGVLHMYRRNNYIKRKAGVLQFCSKRQSWALATTVAKTWQ